MKSKYYNFVKDLFLFAISTFIPKAITFFLVPLYTNYMSTSEYGVVDIVTTTISVLVPLLTLDIADSVLRSTIENKKNNNPYSFGLKMLNNATLIVIGVVIVNKLCGFFEVADWLILLFTIQFYLTGLYGINISYLRATDRIMLLVTTSIINTCTQVLSNIILLVILRMGLNGFLLSNIISLTVVNAIILISINIVHIYDYKRVSLNEKKEMISYSVPLIASSLAWWVNSASDRYFITWFRGLSDNGVYSAAYKIPTILQLAQSVFSQAWLLTIYKEYDKPDGNEFISRVYDLYNSAMCISCSLLIFMDIPLANFLYAKDFHEAWKYVPVLLISVVFIANAGFFETIITLLKQSNVIAKTAIVGALVNLILNYVLILNIGTMGAAVATALGYFVMFILREKFVINLYQLEIKWVKHYFLWFSLCAQTIFTLSYESCWVSLPFFIFICFTNFSLFKKFLINLFANR